MKQLSYFLILLLFSCNSTSSSTEQKEASTPDAPNVEQVKPEPSNVDAAPKKKLYLNGIYEYDYPYDTKDMNENQYIAFKKDGDSVKGWYFGTSDEFDEAREGYLPGYFVSEIIDLIIKGDSIFFNISTGYDNCYSTRFPIGYIDTNKINKTYEKWFATGEDQIIEYEAKVNGLRLYLNMFGETRTYKKTKNYFHPGIDNYDSTKCRTEPLLAVHQNLDSLTDSMIFDFLKTFSVICEANVEFGQSSNELLFKVLSTNPELTLKVLSDNINELDTTSIFEELEAPLHDLIPVDSIKTIIEQLPIDEHIKQTVLNKLPDY